MEKKNNVLKMESGKALDALGKMVPHLETILNDPDYIHIKDKMKSNAEMTAKDIMFDAFVVVAMKNRRALYGIVSAATGKTEKEVEEQPLEETIAALEWATGNAVIGFFTFFALMAAKL